MLVLLVLFEVFLVQFLFLLQKQLFNHCLIELEWHVSILRRLIHLHLFSHIDVIKIMVRLFCFDGNREFINGTSVSCDRES